MWRAVVRRDVAVRVGYTPPSHLAEVRFQRTRYLLLDWMATRASEEAVRAYRRRIEERLGAGALACKGGNTSRLTFEQVRALACVELMDMVLED